MNKSGVENDEAKKKRQSKVYTKKRYIFFRYYGMKNHLSEFVKLRNEYNDAIIMIRRFYLHGLIGI